MIKQGTNENFNQLIENELVLVDFNAKWCGPCRMLSPIIDEIATERSNIEIVKVDVDEEQAIAKTYGVMSIPTLKIFKNGKEIATEVGFMPKEELINWIEKNN